MVAKTFRELLDEASRSNIMFQKNEQSMKWFMQQARSTSVTARQLTRQFDPAEKVGPGQLIIGRMYMFWYDPKHKKKLPYYDRFPCIYPIAFYPDGSMLGINLHYLPYTLRARLMDALYQLETKRVPLHRRFKISYDILASAAKFKYFKPCIKKYLFSHVRSQFLAVPYEAWHVACFLPVHNFVGAGATKVWADSRKKI